MSKSGHINTKRVIEYGGPEMRGSRQQMLLDWLEDCGVDVWVSDDGNGDEWEIDKDTLDNNIKVVGECPSDICTRKEMREFVDALLAAPTGGYAYISWF